jgi:transcription elongation factor Elf1
MTTQPVPALTAAAPGLPRGFANLPCLKCGEAYSITLRIDALDEADALRCAECEAEYGLDDVRAALGAWSAVLAWCELAPALPE